jgi:hypothetical protein
MGYLKLWEYLTGIFYKLPKDIQKDYKKNHNIENGTDFANFVFNLNGIDPITMQEVN